MKTLFAVLLLSWKVIGSNVARL